MIKAAARVERAGKSVRGGQFLFVKKHFILIMTGACGATVALRFVLMVLSVTAKPLPAES
jgi:hypothetical protein